MQIYNEILISKTKKQKTLYLCQMIIDNDTICAIASGNGQGAISIIRLSGNYAIDICNKFFTCKDLNQQKSHTLHFGTFRNHDSIIDEVVVSKFSKPNSYTGEDVIEVSCHGSSYIQRQILESFLSAGARMAKAGEFTLRAFANGKMDLAQAEAVADLIASDDKTSHQIAIHQMRGGVSNELKRLRKELIEFASLIELELDFSEEDVEFADRTKMLNLLHHIQAILNNLLDSFRIGNAIKNGVPVAIIGQPNVGKSTLLNALVNDEKAIVSSQAGTTRDIIEDVVQIQGISFRFYDTAGLRNTTDEIESIGIKRAIEHAKKATILIFLVDATENVNQQINELSQIAHLPNVKPLIVINKIDLTPADKINSEDAIFISAKNKFGITELKDKLVQNVNLNAVESGSTVISNIRHYEALQNALTFVSKVINNMSSGVGNELNSLDVKQALHHLGEITGDITTDDLLDSIFSNFCIGK